MWALYALAASLSQSALRLANQYYKLPGLKLVVIGKIFHLAIALPISLFVTWPTQPLFYVMTALTAPLIVYHNTRLYDLTAKFGAGIVTRIEPLSIPLVFICWLLINPHLLETHLQSPIRSTAIGLCILSTAFFATQMRACKVNFDAIKVMIPVIITLAATAMAAKTAIDYAPNYEGVVVYVLIQALCVLIISLIADRKLSGSFTNPFEDKSLFKASFLVSALLLSAIILRLWGFMLAPNPAYVSAIIQTGPFWVLLFYRFVKHEEKGDIKPGIGIVISAIIMTLLVIK